MPREKLIQNRNKGRGYISGPLDPSFYFFLVVMMVCRVRLWHLVEESTYLTSCSLFIPIPIPGVWMAARRKVGWLREGRGAVLLRVGCRLERGVIP